MTERQQRAALAERAARAGGAVAREAFRGDLEVETKANKNDLVTETDRDAQRQVVATIQSEFPTDAFLTEEELVTLSGPEAPNTDPTAVDEIADTGATWVVDPIDGTSNFVRGMRTWATSVAVVLDGETIGAATYMPAEGDLYASGPESVTRDGSPLSVSDRTDPETFAVAPVGWYGDADAGTFGRLCGALADRCGDTRRLGCFQATLALVAQGSLDAAVCTEPTYPWDTVAGVHMIRQAGGTVTDLGGDRWQPDSDGLVASNDEAHDELLAAAADARDE